MTAESDVIVVGAGHNGLVAALLLQRAGLRVLVLEDKDMIGGACKTEHPFKKAPEIGTSTGAYLLGLMPPELLKILSLDLPLRRRDPHYFLPTSDRSGRYLLFGSDRAAMESQFRRFFSDADWAANARLNEELSALRDDIAPTWLKEPLSIEDTAERHVRPALQKTFVDLCRGPIAPYLDRFGFKSDLLKAMYAVTDAFSGLDGSLDTPGTGMNFLIHNMCRLPGSDGTWMIVEGGMGTVTRRIGDAARAAGAVIRTGVKVARIEHHGGAVSGVVTTSGETHAAKVVVVNADPFRMLDLVDKGLPPDYVARLRSMRRDGTTFKLNLCLSGLPKFTCLPEDRGQYGPTIHLLPDESVVIAELRRAYAQAKAGELPDWPSIEWYLHTTIDPSLQGGGTRHNAALFVQWAPNRVKGSSWAVEEERFARHLLSICDRFAPGTSDLVVDMLPLSPESIESYFGISHGHIHHIDNAYGFADRVPYAQPLAGLFSCSAGCHPAGSVIGASGHNAAQAVLRAMGRKTPA
jgi:phytoene dehydrogenase-like protein